MSSCRPTVVAEIHKTGAIVAVVVAAAVLVMTADGGGWRAADAGDAAACFGSGEQRVMMWAPRTPCRRFVT